MRNKLTVVAVAGFLSLLCACSLFSEPENPAAGPESAGQNVSASRLEQNLPADSQLITQKLTYMLTPSDRIYVLNAGDYTTSGSLYENSGSNIQYQIARSLEQHGSTVTRQQGYFDPNLMMQEAQYHNCNLIMTARIERLSDNPIYTKDISILLNTYSANTGDLLNSVILNGRADSLQSMFALNGGIVGQLINNYINALYHKVGSL